MDRSSDFDPFDYPGWMERIRFTTPSPGPPGLRNSLPRTPRRPRGARFSLPPWRNRPMPVSRRGLADTGPSDTPASPLLPAAGETGLEDDGRTLPDDEDSESEEEGWEDEDDEEEWSSDGSAYPPHLGNRGEWSPVSRTSSLGPPGGVALEAAFEEMFIPSKGQRLPVELENSLLVASERAHGAVGVLRANPRALNALDEEALYRFYCGSIAGLSYMARLGLLERLFPVGPEGSFSRVFLVRELRAIIQQLSPRNDPSGERSLARGPADSLALPPFFPYSPQEWLELGTDTLQQDTPMGAPLPAAGQSLSPLAPTPVEAPPPKPLSRRARRWAAKQRMQDPSGSAPSE